MHCSTKNVMMRNCFGRTCDMTLAGAIIDAMNDWSTVEVVNANMDSWPMFLVANQASVDRIPPVVRVMNSLDAPLDTSGHPHLRFPDPRRVGPSARHSGAQRELHRPNTAPVEQ
jgi:hypothetical protein